MSTSTISPLRQRMIDDMTADFILKFVRYLMNRAST